MVSIRKGLSRALALLLPALLAAALAVLLYAPAQAKSRSALDKDVAEKALRAHGFEIVTFKDWQESRNQTKSPATRLVVTNVPYTSMYGSETRMDFMVVARGREILLDVRKPTVAGSVDEKLPYIYFNALANLPAREYALLMSGGGGRQSALKWAQGKAGETPGFHVFVSLDDFFAWLDRLPAAQ